MTPTKTSPPSARLRNRAVVTLLSLGAALAGLGLWRLVDSYDAAPPTRPVSSIRSAIDDAAAAREPFLGLTETRVRVGATSMRVVVADDIEERTEGLRERRTIGAYDGMLFVYPEPVTAAFTMSTVPVALDIVFYDAAGRVVSRLRMQPCAGSDAECPVYRPDGAFRYALETLADDLPNGRLTG